MNGQIELVLETVNDAMVEIVRSLGGPKKVGPILWPEKTIDAAGRQLADCLNSDRAAHLTPEQMTLLFTLARRGGYHGAKRWFDEATGYVPGEPMEPEDERAKLQRAFNDSVALQAQLVARLERLGVAPSLKAVAR